LALLGLLAFTPVSYAWEDDDEAEKAKVKAPKVVKKAVKAAYPKAKIRNVSQEKNEEGETVYEVELTVKGQNIDLIVDEEGEIEETEKTIALSDLPGAVLRSIKAKFPKASIKKAEELTLEDDKVLFEITLTLKGKKPAEVVIVPNGKIIELKMTEDEDEGEKPEAKKKVKGEDKEEMDDEEDEDDDKKPKAKKKGNGEAKEEMDDDEDEDDDAKTKKSEKKKGED
jgi:hypothetical protein